MNLQAKLAQYVEDVGNLGFEQWRAFCNQKKEDDGPFRFLDGEMLERFLDLSGSTQEEVCEGLGPSAEEFRNMIEELRRLH
jgi:DNA damage-binding protein 1